MGKFNSIKIKNSEIISLPKEKGTTYLQQKNLLVNISTHSERSYVYCDETVKSFNNGFG